MIVKAISTTQLQTVTHQTTMAQRKYAASGGLNSSSEFNGIHLLKELNTMATEKLKVFAKHWQTLYLQPQ